MRDGAGAVAVAVDLRARVGHGLRIAGIVAAAGEGEPCRSQEERERDESVARRHLARLLPSVKRRQDGSAS